MVLLYNVEKEGEKNLVDTIAKFMNDFTLKLQKATKSEYLSIPNLKFIIVTSEPIKTDIFTYKKISLNSLTVPCATDFYLRKSAIK